MRNVSAALVLGAPILVIFLVATRSPGSVQAAPSDGISLMQTLAEWQYPGSGIHGGATMSDGGNPVVQSIKCAAVLTTSDPIEKVVAFYVKKFGLNETTTPPTQETLVKKGEAKSVSVHDDSRGRLLTLRVIVVNKIDTSTTLVISRAEGEEQTHIAWLHYLRLDGRK